jgi:hypothetical protein
VNPNKALQPLHAARFKSIGSRELAGYALPRGWIAMAYPADVLWERNVEGAFLRSVAKRLIYLVEVKQLVRSRIETQSIYFKNLVEGAGAKCAFDLQKQIGAPPATNSIWIV